MEDEEVTDRAPLSDHEVLVCIVTAFLIREGGRTMFSVAEWEAAVEREGSLYFSRGDEDDPMQVALMTKTRMT